MLTKYDLRILVNAMQGTLKTDSPRKRENNARVMRELRRQQESSK
jgi:hypothetical protein